MLNTISGFLGGAAAAVIPGDYESIATTVVGGGGASSITFSSIPSTYKHLQIRASLKTNDTASSLNDLVMYMNADTTFTNYYSHWVKGNGSTASAGNVQTGSYFVYLGSATSSASGQGSMFSTNVVDILDYKSTSKNKVTRYLNGADLNGSGEFFLGSGLWKNTSAITSLTLRAANTGFSFVQYSSFALYGIKG